MTAVTKLNHNNEIRRLRNERNLMLKPDKSSALTAVNIKMEYCRFRSMFEFDFFGESKNTIGAIRCRNAENK